MTGWLRPCVLLPLEAATWPETTLQAALRHEYQHARQHDGLHRMCAALLQAVFWWNPALHALCRVYEADSEVCCDLEAAAASNNRREYGELLLAHATGMPPRGLAMPFARCAGLRGRMERLLAVPRHSPWVISTRWLTAVVLMVAAGMLVAAIRIAPFAVPPDSAMENEALIRLNADPFPNSP
jgi:beta-lactamase regulating signal transducer with metallopeptidase domain